MKRSTIALLLLPVLAIALVWLSFRSNGMLPVAMPLPHTSIPKHPERHVPLRLVKSKDALSFVEKNGFNSDFCFLIDMSLSSGKNRFFVYDLKGDSVLQSGLVTHGRCNLDWLEGRRYDNRIGSGCTSLGKYKLGYSYMGRFGLAFKLHGLEKSNSNAFARYVVLHAHECVPETEVADEICQSDGCPTVSPGFLQKLKPLIRDSKKPVLLWIY